VTVRFRPEAPAFEGPANRLISGVFSFFITLKKGLSMATPNYAFIKRQKDLAKKAKKEEKKQAKLRGEVVTDDAEDDNEIEVDQTDATAETSSAAPI
jgi:hypothetical protein